MKNTSRTTVREGRQSSDNIYVRIAAVTSVCTYAFKRGFLKGHLTDIQTTIILSMLLLL